MALVKCKECGTEISTAATACPKCGAKPRKTVGVLGVFIALVVGFTVYKCTRETSTPAAEQRAVATAQAPAAAVWGYRDMTDPMTSTKGRMATIDATKQLSLKFPYAGHNQPFLGLRRKGGSTDVMIVIGKGQIICHSGCHVEVRFDDGKAERYSGSMPADLSTTTIFLSPEKKLIEKIKKAKKTVVLLNIYQEGSNALEFNTAGLVW